MKAMHDAFSNDWFQGYDWVIRINPDVIIYDEGRLFSFMDMPNMSGIFVACCWGNFHYKKWQFKKDSCSLSSDFFAVRPDKLSKDAWASYKTFGNAEKHATS